MREVREAHAPHLRGSDRARRRARCDAYYWLGHAEAGDCQAPIEALRRTAELILDEFEKVVALRSAPTRRLAEAEAAQRRCC